MARTMAGKARATNNSNNNGSGNNSQSRNGNISPEQGGQIDDDASAVRVLAQTQSSPSASIALPGNGSSSNGPGGILRPSGSAGSKTNGSSVGGLRERKVADSDHPSGFSDDAPSSAEGAARKMHPAAVVAVNGSQVGEYTETSGVRKRNSIVTIDAEPGVHDHLLSPSGEPAQGSSSSSSISTSASDSSEQKEPPYDDLDHSQVFLKLSDYDCFIDHPSSCINQYTVRIHDMPSWYSDNSFIKRGYRRITNSYIGCFNSLFYVHNESGNVYTHLIGVFVFLAFIAMFYISWLSTKDIPTTTWADAAALACFHIGAISCLALSTMFHLCCCHSKNVNVLWNKADYLGIVTLIVGSIIPAIYYLFYCSPITQAVYIASIVICGAATLCVSFMARFATANYRSFRALLFVALGLFGIFPIVHTSILYGFSGFIHIFSGDDILLMGALYLLGAFIYGYRIPERWIPGVFDIWGHSHQIWHILVLSAAAVHYSGIYRMYQWRHRVDPYCQLSVANVRSMAQGM